MTTWKLAALIGGVAAAAVTGTVLVLGLDDAGGRDRRAPATMVARQGDADDGREFEGGGAVQDLMQDPDFRKDLWALQDEQQTAMRAWWDKYGDDPTSNDAREAMQKLREDQRAKLEKLFDKYGVDIGDGGLMGRGGMPGGGLPGWGSPGDGPSGNGQGHGSPGGSGDATGAGGGTAAGPSSGGSPTTF